MRDVLGDGRDGAGEVGHPFGEVVSQGWEESAFAGAGLVEVVDPEVTAPEEFEDVSVDDGSQDFQEVEDEAVAVPLVGVDDAEAGVEADGEDGDAAFSFGEGVAVVEERVDGVGGAAWALAAV
ncbi:MAG: hypothetical protein M3R02_23940 [Chloroflexota bacterium]|nr:hypothetical protein [Chloroflexota bacterium]